MTFNLLKFIYFISRWVYSGIGKNYNLRDFPGGPVVKNLLANAGDQGLIPGGEDPMSWEQGEATLHHN